jgi:hypothetical protein
MEANEQLLQRAPRAGVGERGGAEERLLLEAAGLHDEVVERAVVGRHLKRELVALAAEGHVAERAVQFLQLAAHVHEVFAEPEDDVLRELLDRLFLRLRDALAILGQPAFTPEIALPGELLPRLALDVGRQAVRVDVLGLEMDKPQDEPVHAAVDVAELALEDVAHLGRAPLLALDAVA